MAVGQGSFPPEAALRARVAVDAVAVQRRFTPAERAVQFHSGHHELVLGHLDLVGDHTVGHRGDRRPGRGGGVLEIDGREATHVVDLTVHQLGCRDAQLLAVGPDEHVVVVDHAALAHQGQSQFLHAFQQQLALGVDLPRADGTLGGLGQQLGQVAGGPSRRAVRVGRRRAASSPGAARCARSASSSGWPPPPGCRPCGARPAPAPGSCHCGAALGPVPPRSSSPIRRVGRPGGHGPILPASAAEHLVDELAVTGPQGADRRTVRPRHPWAPPPN